MKNVQIVKVALQRMMWVLCISTGMASLALRTPGENIIKPKLKN